MHCGTGKQTSEGISEDLGTTWVIDLLQWSQSLTFNSSLILRHLTRLLYLSATSPMTPAPKNNMLAKRTLQLYIQVVGKAWEASKEGVGEDMDADVRWVETLVFGARMLASDVARYYQAGGKVDSPTILQLPGIIVRPSNAYVLRIAFCRSLSRKHGVPGTTSPRPSALHASLEDDEAQVNEIHEAMEVLKKARLRIDAKNKRLLGKSCSLRG